MRGDISSPVHTRFAREATVAGNITTQNFSSAGAATTGSAVEYPVNECDILCVQVTGTYI